MNATQRAEVLGHARVFAKIPRNDLAVLAEMMQTESFLKGNTVVEVNEPADRVYVVAAGTLSVWVPNTTTRARLLRPGDVLGEYGMVSGSSARTATVKADEDSVLLSLDYERFHAYLVRFPEALWVLFEGAAKRLIEAERRSS